ncbi:MAG TPA: Mor transcription activator family protein [Ottowia sp.]|nr:Mor transcription activator family protein [Ottowia sp.]
MGRKSRQKLYQFVDALVETGTRALVNDALVEDQDRAREVMREIAHSICDQYARSVLYVPADLEFRLSKRDARIWDEYGQDGADGARKFSPQRVAQLADEHKLTTVQIYCIVKLMMRREIESRQGRLPGLEEAEEVAV